VTSRNLWKTSSTVHVTTKIAGSRNDDTQEGNDGLMHKSVDGFQRMEFPLSVKLLYCVTGKVCATSV
jgi:hypothetical protein